MGNRVPAAVVIVPCHNEAAYLPDLLTALVTQLEGQAGWWAVLVEDSSTDATATLLAQAAADHPQLLRVHYGRFGSPGAARSAGVAVAEAFASDRGDLHTQRYGQDAAGPPSWLIGIDADVLLSSDWVSSWAQALAAADPEQSIGALNGEEDQSHLLAPFPRAGQLSARFGAVAQRSEDRVGVTNLNGVNHAVRLGAYHACGPYRQPTGVGPDGPVVLAGEDWDLGLRLRLAGYTIAPTTITVADRGRRLLADLAAYLGGTAYEGAFRRVQASGPAQDLDAEQLARFWPGAARRAVLHFYAKPILALPGLLESDVGLSGATVAAMRAWMARWPAPTFSESRNGFLYGRLPRFVDAFLAVILDELDLHHRLAGPTSSHPQA